MRRLGAPIALLLLLLACSEDAPEASARIPRVTATPPTATSVPEPADAGATQRSGRPVALAVGDERACAAVESGTAVRVHCWRLSDFGRVLAPSLAIGDMVGRAGWFLGRDRSATYAWGTAPVGGTLDAGVDGGARVATIRFGSVDQPYASDRAAAGPRHACAIDRNEELFCWGDDSACQTSATPSCAGGEQDMVDLSDILGSGVRFTGVAAGAAHTCAIASTGTGATANVYCWGANDSGETGQPASPRSAPEPLPLVPPVKSNELAVAAGDHHGCAIVLGDLYCWGKNDAQQAAPGNAAPIVPPSKVDLSAVVGKVTRLALGGDRTCFVLSPLTGTLPPRAFCFAQNRVAEVPDLEGITHLALSSRHACAIGRSMSEPKSLASVYCWTGSERPKLVPLTVP